MEICVELLRLGDFFQSDGMKWHGKGMLARHLATFLNLGCDPDEDSATKEAWLTARPDFPSNFCGAVVNAFDNDRPVKLAQDMFADFAFAARIYLFKNEEFLSFVKDKVVPEFGNLVLTALMTGYVSNVFDNQYIFKQWRDWQVTPQAPPLPKAEAPSSSGASPSPEVTTGSGTAAPQVASQPGPSWGAGLASPGGPYSGWGRGSGRARRRGGRGN